MYRDFYITLNPADVHVYDDALENETLCSKTPL